MQRVKDWTFPSIFLLSAGLYTYLLYFVPRQEFGALMGICTLLFLGYGYILFQTNRQAQIPHTPNFPYSPYTFIAVGLAMRLIALFALPQLSDDYFRFVWDGRLLAQGINPFLKLPSEYMADPEAAASIGLTEEIFLRLNSKNYFTIYPPILQGIFSFGAYLFPKNLLAHIWVMKSCVFLAEATTLWILLRLLRKMKLSENGVIIYALNPLVIIELTGNLHFEALMIMGLLWAVLELGQKNWLRATIPFAIAVGSKLLPLMLLPLLIRRLGWVKAILFGAIVIALTGLMFVPIMDIDTFLHLGESVGLYFQSFEFNASIYYLVRWIGFQITGYNIIQQAGPVLALITVLSIFAITFLEKPDNLGRSMMWVFLLYLALSSIVHPWYMIVLVALCGITRNRFPLVWSFFILLSYATYRTTAYEESMWLVVIEYVVLAICVGLELRKKRTNLLQYFSDQ